MSNTRTRLTLWPTQQYLIHMLRPTRRPLTSCSGHLPQNKNRGRILLATGEKNVEVPKSLGNRVRAKSTLLVYIYKDGPYHNALFARSENVPLITASFHASKGSTDLPKTRETLLGSLLYEIIDEMPAL